MTHAFLCWVYKSESGQSIYEIATSGRKDFINFGLRYVDHKGLMAIAEDPSYRKDFYVENGYLGWEGETIIIQDDVVDRLNGISLDVYTHNEHIYTFLLKMAQLDARYLDRKAFEHVKEHNEIPEYGVNRMSAIKVSNSSMRVHISVLTEEGWRTRSLIKNEEGLQLEPFYILIEKDRYPEITDHAGVFVEKSLTIGAQEFMLYSVSDGMSLYPEYSNGFKILKPLLAWKLYNATLNNSVVDFLDYFIKETSKSMFGYVEPEKAEYTQEYESKGDTSGVFLKLHTKKPRRAVHPELRQEVFKLLKKAVSPDVRYLRPDIQKSGFKHLEQQCMFVLAHAILSSNPTPLDRLEAVKSIRNELKAESVRLELDLFAVRSHIYIKNVSFPDYTDHVLLVEGTSQFIGEMYKVGSFE